MKKIVFDCERMKYASTGLYHFSLNLGSALMKKAIEGEEALTFFVPPNAIGAFGKDLSYLKQHSLQKLYLPSLKEFDIWHATYQSSDYVPRRNKKIKVVLSIHDLNFFYENKSEKKREKYLRHLQQNVDRSDAIICISDFCRQDVLQHCDTHGKPVHVIYNGTNSLKAPALTQLSYKPKKPFLFSLGSICRKKNFHVLLQLLTQNNGLELIIAGRPDDLDYLEYIRQSAQQLKVAEYLRILGPINEHEKSWYYSNCYAFAFPSIAEGFGLPVAEAMSVGKPVFLSDKTALPEIGRNMAFYFRDFSADHMQNVFLSGMEEYIRNDMHTAIREHGASFSWDKAAGEYMEVYRSLY
ncbi:glycosyltransferase family 4 protein [Filimonas effusa]|uniref:Glycosyltransferase family 1 protein n=1 Tax=Filimonas effusa TaxID=2508721 RepID=A0A4V1MAL2_9BACT|nr:glycosyltransferase family 1 protein [Filimonas effusa]RXK86266.1 glycosyltransferase family 1 protein [Filimonas effusa]